MLPKLALFLLIIIQNRELIYLGFTGVIQRFAQNKIFTTVRDFSSRRSCVQIIFQFLAPKVSLKQTRLGVVQYPRFVRLAAMSDDVDDQPAFNSESLQSALLDMREILGSLSKRLETLEGSRSQAATASSSKAVDVEAARAVMQSDLRAIDGHLKAARKLFSATPQLSVVQTSCSKEDSRAAKLARTACLDFTRIAEELDALCSADDGDSLYKVRALADAARFKMRAELWTMEANLHGPSVSKEARAAAVAAHWASGDPHLLAADLQSREQAAQSAKAQQEWTRMVRSWGKPGGDRRGVAAEGRQSEPQAAARRGKKSHQDE